MGIARAAKGAAFLLMVFGLVALIGCQQAATGRPGATGAAGPAGGTGPDGPDGPAGAAGPDGPDALSARGASDRYRHYVDVTEDAETEGAQNNLADTAVKIGDLRSPIDAAAQFVGGKPPLTYEITTGVPAGPPASTFTAVIDEKTGMVTVALRDETQEKPLNGADTAALDTNPIPAYDWDVVDGQPTSIFTVTATDADGISATKGFVILFNRAPRFKRSGTRDVWAFTVGTTDTSKKTMTIVPSAVAVEATHFNDHYVKNTTYTLWGDVPDKIRVIPDPKDDKKFEIKGITSTWWKNPDDCTGLVPPALPAGKPEGYCYDVVTDPVTPDDYSPGHRPVKFRVRAEDEGGESRSGWATVRVNEAPKLKHEFEAQYTVEAGDTLPINNVSGFFEDWEGDAITGDAEVKTSSAAHAVGSISSDTLTITGVNPGSAILTIKVMSNISGLYGPPPPLPSPLPTQATEAKIKVRVVRAS